jgi:hypothetical protein
MCGHAVTSLYNSFNLLSDVISFFAAFYCQQCIRRQIFIYLQELFLTNVISDKSFYKVMSSCFISGRHYSGNERTRV